MTDENTELPITGGQIIVDTLRRLGITELFALPGAQSLGLFDALRRTGGLELRIAIQDSCAVGLADGKARISGQLAAVNLYEFAGLANAAGAIYSALLDRSPLLVLGTVADNRQSGRGWSAETTNLLSFAQELTKLAIEVPRVDRLEETLRRAAFIAQTPPCGPVFVGIPAQLYLEHAPAPSGMVAPLRGDRCTVSPDDPAIVRTAELLLSEEQSVLVGGAGVAESGGMQALERLAENFALPTYVEPYSTRALMHSSHPFYFRVHHPGSPTFKAARVVVGIGNKVAKRFAYMPFEFSLPHQRLCHIHEDPNEICRVYPTEAALVAPCGSAILALEQALAARVDRAAQERIDARRVRVLAAKQAFDVERRRGIEDNLDQEPAHWAGALHEIGRALRPEDVVVDETIGLRHFLPIWMDLPDPARYFGTSAGFMGWGPPAVCGVATGLTKGKAVLLAGDGCFLMTPQAMWSAANLRAPVVFVVFNNRGWVCLKAFYDVVRKLTGDDPNADRIGCDIDDPPVDYVAMAKSFGVPGRVVRSARELGPAMREALAANGPVLLDVWTAQHTSEQYSFPRV